MKNNTINSRMKPVFLLLFVLFSSFMGAQSAFPPPAMANLSKQRLIDEYIETSHYKEALINYAKSYLKLKMFDYSANPPKEQFTKDQARSIINNFDFDGLKTSLYSSFSFISEENLKELIKFHKSIGGKLSKDNSIFLISPTVDLNIKNLLDYAIKKIKR